MIKIFYKILGLICFIPSELTSWIIGKKWMNKIINGNYIAINTFLYYFEKDFENIIDFIFTSIIFAKIFYSKHNEVYKIFFC